MTAPEADPGVVRLLLDWAWAGVLFLGGVLHRIRGEQIKDMRISMDRMISRAEFERHEEREDRDRSERRDAESTLFDKLEALDTKIDAKLTLIFDRLMGGK